jgi:hypothetical protein
MARVKFGCSKVTNCKIERLKKLKIVADYSLVKDPLVGVLKRKKARNFPGLLVLFGDYPVTFFQPKSGLLGE